MVKWKVFKVEDMENFARSGKKARTKWETAGKKWGQSPL